MIYWIYALLLSHMQKAPWKIRAAAAIPLLVSCGLFLLPVTEDTGIQLAGEDASATPSLIAQAEINDVAISPRDLEGIKRSGQLRVLRHKPPSRAATMANVELDLLKAYASEQGLRLAWHDVSEMDVLVRRLRDGHGDIALLRSAGVHEAGDAGISLTLPWGVSQQQVITRSDTGRIRNLDDLRTRQVALRASSPLFSRLQAMADRNPSMSLVLIAEQESSVNVLGKLASAQYDVTVMDNLVAEHLLPTYLNLEVAFNVGEAETLSWAVRSQSPALEQSLNSYLDKHYLQSQIARTYKGDLPELQAKKLLRLVTYQSPVNYFLHRGKLRGFEHDLLKRFAESRQLRLAVVIADSHEEMQQLLLEGKGDVIAASLPRTSYPGVPEVAFSESYSHATPVVVGRTKDTPLTDARGLAGRRIVLPASSPYVHEVRRIQDRGIDVDLVIAQPGESTERVLFKVANGMYDLTVIGSHESRAQFARQINIRAHFGLAEPLPQAWAVRTGDTQLLNSLNEFISKEFRKGFYNVLYSKYIEKPRKLLGDTQLLASMESLSPYDDIVHKYASHYDFDWRLIVAQMYQESQFNPDAISYAGAEGLMQIIPETADLLGIDNAYDPDTSIQGGIRYMDYLRGKFEQENLLEDRIWFALASYNAGYNRVQRARQLARRMNLDPDKWFDNVEIAMMSMARPYWKDGVVERNCRCGQTVVYVRDIRTLYNNYVRLTRSLKTVSNTRNTSKDI